MGRPRKSGHHLPEKVYQDKKSGMFYFVDSDNKYHALGRQLYEALNKYYELMPHQAKIITMGHLISRYMVEESPKKASSTHRDEKKSAKQLSHRLGHLYPQDVTTVHIAEYYKVRCTEATVRPNRELSLLSVIFKQAPFWGVSVINPVPSIKRVNEGARRAALKQSRYITDEQVLIFKKFAPEWLRLYVELKLLTGLRQTAMLKMRSAHVTQDCLLVPDIPKRGGMLQISWNDKLRLTVSKIRSLNDGQNDFFFTSRTGEVHNDESFKSAWQRAMAIAVENGLTKKFSERFLRNKAVTDCLDLDKASKTVGHTNTSVTKQHYSMLGSRVEPFDKCV
ncbi:hypothetical protein BM524_01335 [Alteromonas mediterranea]|uniref:Tyr recombinase domain-containing protein n=1 Tax=Alteromonas mediterranea TaxID=314275 RepID=A0AAC9NQC4_9ALTE|nr:tyrosine-type recombinase/integrase [Alteromonas mediterranea]APD88561.1 hypothetical protein BM524_01335 [Alteromonas mediterranea]